MSGYAALALDPRAQRGVVGFAAAHVVELIAHAPQILADAPAERLSAPTLLSMMLEHIGRHCSDPRLGAAALARQFRCSQRYVHKLFAATGRPVGDHVGERRLDACARHLQDPAQRARTIAEIAFAAGFGDLSHFNKRFKASHGVSPREFRRAALAASGLEEA